MRSNRTPSDSRELKDVDHLTRADLASQHIGSTDLQPYFDLLTRARRFVLAALVLGGCLGFLDAWSRPAVYEAAATLLVSRSKIGTDATAAVPAPVFRAFVINNLKAIDRATPTPVSRGPSPLVALGAPGLAGPVALSAFAVS